MGFDFSAGLFDFDGCSGEVSALHLFLAGLRFELSAGLLEFDGSSGEVSALIVGDDTGGCCFSGFFVVVVVLEVCLLSRVNS